MGKKKQSVHISATVGGRRGSRVTAEVMRTAGETASPVSVSAKRLSMERAAASTDGVEDAIRKISDHERTDSAGSMSVTHSFYGTKSIEDEAATCLQAVFRGHATRRLQAKLLAEEQAAAALSIQGRFRGRLARKQFKEAKTQREKETAAALILQCAWRSKKSREEYARKRKARKEAEEKLKKEEAARLAAAKLAAAAEQVKVEPKPAPAPVPEQPACCCTIM